jgi:signal transduction histidine kinase
MSPAEPGGARARTGNGADAYLNHPVDPTLLVATVRSLLRARRAEDVEQLLTDANEAFTDSLEPIETAHAMAAASVPRVADACVVVQPREPGERSEPIIRAHPGLQAGLERVFKESSADGQGNHLRDALAAIGIKHAVTVPLVARSRPLGTATFYSTGEAFDEEAVRVLTSIARRASMAIDNARLFREADAARHDAQVANAAKVDFLAAMSHELRTPLNAIAGFVDLMALGIHGPITAEQTPAAVQDEALSTLIEDILNYAKLEAGRLEYDMQQVIAGDALAEVHTLARSVFDAKGVDFEYVPGDAGAIVSADPDRLRQVLLNVVGNAAKFTPPGGSVVLTSAADAQNVGFLQGHRARHPDGARLDLRAVRAGDRHLNPSASQGIGLGLSISRDLMRGMDGDLVVESEPGAGSTFTIVLQRSRTSREAARDASSVAAPR